MQHATEEKDRMSLNLEVWDIFET